VEIFATIRHANLKVEDIKTPSFQAPWPAFKGAQLCLQAGRGGPWAFEMLENDLAAEIFA
jgi:hypothetical protein